MAKNYTEKLFYSIGEVSKITKIKAHVLRYWESEFKLLSLEKNNKGERLYRSKDIDLILKIKQLLYDEGYTIQGAKKRLKKEKQGEVLVDASKLKQEHDIILQEIKEDLKKLYREI